MLQTGAWKTTVIVEGIRCNAWTFPTDLQTAYLAAARAAFRQSIEHVSFTPRTLKPNEIREQGSDAQITVYEGGLGASLDGRLGNELLVTRARSIIRSGYSAPASLARALRETDSEMTPSNVRY